MEKPENFAAYLNLFPKDTQDRLLAIENLAQQLLPTAIICISYGMPCFKLKGKVVFYFAAYKNHIGFYALPITNVHFKTALEGYKQGKGSIQFSLEKPLPMGLIEEMIRYRKNTMEGK